MNSQYAGPVWSKMKSNLSQIDSSADHPLIRTIVFKCPVVIKLQARSDFSALNGHSIILSIA